MEAVGPPASVPTGARGLHSWTVSIDEARSIQERLAREVVARDEVGPVKLVAGADVAFPQKGQARAAVVVLSYPDWHIAARSRTETEVAFPYVPGLLSFREAPPIIKAWERLDVRPDLLLVDGQGYAHPRRLGLACHLGLVLDVPTIGCAKSRLTGEAEPLGGQRGSRSELRDPDTGEVIGAVVRTRSGVNPLYVSVGHRVDLPGAVRWTLACCTRYRVPEPLRQAHLAASGQGGPQESSGRQLSLFDG